MLRTNGISPKVWRPVAVQVVAFLVNLIASGEFDRVEVAQLVGLALTAVIGWASGPGDVESVPPTPDKVDPAAGDVRPPA